MHGGHGWCACREERDKVEREAKEKEWAAQEAERSGEWYYKEVRHLFRHSMPEQHTQEGLAMLQRCLHSLEAPRSSRCAIVDLSKSACTNFPPEQNKIGGSSGRLCLVVGSKDRVRLGY